MELNLLVAFVAGLASFLSPCVLPLVPGFLAYLSGTSVGSNDKHDRIILFLNSLAFVLGFSFVFAILGVLLNSALERIAYDVQIWLSRLGGLVIIFFGLYVLQLIKIPFLDQERKLHVKKKFKSTYITSFVFGAAFAVGWSPCVGAILGAVFGLAISNPGLAFALLMSYAIGLGVPFLLVGLFSDKAIKLIKKSSTFLKYFNIIVGILLLILGVLVFTNNLNLIAYLAPIEVFVG